MLKRPCAMKLINASVATPDPCSRTQARTHATRVATLDILLASPSIAAR